MTNQLLQLLFYPDTRLKQVSVRVTEFDDKLKQLVSNMFYTTKKHGGIGLAAPQVGVFKRLFITNIDQPRVFINPEIILAEGTSSFEEGCLSVPGYFENIKRAEKVIISFQNEKGDVEEISATGLHATCIQHEIDHLNGIVFVDHLSKLKQIIAKKKVQKTLKHEG